MNICFQKTYQRAFGTYPLKGEVLAQAIAAAAEVGYRAFDTAQMYGNEADTGAALKATGLKRADLCITTKVHPDNFSRGEVPSFGREKPEGPAGRQGGYPAAALAADRGRHCARRLRLLEQALERGLTDNIGVSNYTVQMMQDARTIVDAPLVTNQVEFHPLLDQSVLMRGAEETGIPLSSYSSVARGEVFKHPIFAEIGAGYGKSAAQVVLRWILQKGVSLNTMSTNPANIRANFEIMDFTLSHHRHGADRCDDEDGLPDRDERSGALGAGLGLKELGRRVSEVSRTFVTTGMVRNECAPYRGRSAPRSRRSQRIDRKRSGGAFPRSDCRRSQDRRQGALYTPDAANPSAPDWGRRGNAPARGQAGADGFVDGQIRQERPYPFPRIRSAACSPIMIGRRVGVRADEAGHDRAVADAQPIEAVDPKLRIDHGHRIHPHAAGADRMVGGAAVLPGIGLELAPGSAPRRRESGWRGCISAGTAGGRSRG